MDDKIPPIHPGEHLLEDFLKPMGISPYELASSITVPPHWIVEILQGKRPITAEMAIRLGRYFGMEYQFWINLQNRYDLDIAMDALAGRLEVEVLPLAA